MKIYNVILSGDVESRLWPLSRKNHQKQFLKIFEGKSLFQLTAERNKSVVDELMVVGNSDHIQWSKSLEAWGKSQNNLLDEASCRQIPSISIDYV